MASKHYITIPSGRRVSVGRYVHAWKVLKAADPASYVDNWNWYPTKVRDILFDLRRGMHDRINRHIPGYDKGRKWGDDYQLELIRLRPFLDNPRLAMHQVHHILDRRIKNALQHRISHG